MRNLQIVHETFANVCKQSQNVETTSKSKNVENIITQIAVSKTIAKHKKCKFLQRHGNITNNIFAVSSKTTQTHHDHIDLQNLDYDVSNICKTFAVVAAFSSYDSFHVNEQIGIGNGKIELKAGKLLEEFNSFHSSTFPAIKFYILSRCKSQVELRVYLTQNFLLSFDVYE